MSNLVKCMELRQELFAEVSNTLKLKCFHKDHGRNLTLIVFEFNQMMTGGMKNSFIVFCQNSSP